MKIITKKIILKESCVTIVSIFRPTCLENEQLKYVCGRLYLKDNEPLNGNSSVPHS